MGIRPEDICLDPESIQRWRENAIRACADACEEDEERNLHDVSHRGRGAEGRECPGRRRFSPGIWRELTVDSSKIYIFDKDTQKAI